MYPVSFFRIAFSNSVFRIAFTSDEKQNQGVISISLGIYRFYSLNCVYVCACANLDKFVMLFPSLLPLYALAICSQIHVRDTCSFFRFRTTCNHLWKGNVLSTVVTHLGSFANVFFSERNIFEKKLRAQSRRPWISRPIGSLRTGTIFISFFSLLSIYYYLSFCI